MRRDPELLRQLVFQLEAIEARPGAILHIPVKEMVVEGFSYEQVYYHINQILLSGWIETAASGGGISASGRFCFKCLSPAGHDFVDSVRDEKIWQLTKAGADQAGGWTLDVLAALGKGFLKKQVERLTDIQLEF